MRLGVPLFEAPRLAAALHAINPGRNGNAAWPAMSLLVHAQGRGGQGQLLRLLEACKG